MRREKDIRPDRPSRGLLGSLVQFVKFGMVGALNTAVSYAIEMLGLYVVFAGVWNEGAVTVLGRAVKAPDFRWAVCATLGFIAGVVNSYLLNSRFVFRKEDGSGRRGGRAFARMALCSLATTLVLSYFLKLWLNSALGFAPWLASLCALAVATPLNFLLTKFWAFGDR